MSNPFRYFNSSPEIIRLAVLMYVKYPLSLGEYLRLEYQRHTRRHAFYEEYHGGWHMLQCVENAMPTLTT